MIDIQHAQWQCAHKEMRREHKVGGTFTYDVFVNPDTHSSIAAVVVRRYASNDTATTSIDVSLVENKSAMNAHAQALWKRYGLVGIEYAPYEAVKEGLAKLQVKVPSRLTAVLVGQQEFHEDAETAKAHTAERLAHLVRTFRGSDVLSESVAVCTAFLEAMCGELEDLREIYQPSDKNKKTGGL